MPALLRLSETEWIMDALEFTLASDIRVGDRIAYEGRPHAVVMREAENYTDPFGRTLRAFWCRVEGTPSREGWVPFGPGGGFPVIRGSSG